GRHRLVGVLSEGLQHVGQAAYGLVCSRGMAGGGSHAASGTPRGEVGEGPARRSPCQGGTPNMARRPPASARASLPPRGRLSARIRGQNAQEGGEDTPFRAYTRGHSRRLSTDSLIERRHNTATPAWASWLRGRRRRRRWTVHVFHRGA